MRVYRSKPFGKVPQPASFSELMEATLSEHPRWGRVRMWRGQADIGWPIHSTAYRRMAKTGMSLKEGTLQSYEKHLLGQATHRGYRQLEGRRLSDLELLARLQHHGAATRLVDFTRNALVGLWFVVSSELKKTGALIGIHTAFLAGYEAEPDERPYTEVMDDLHAEAPDTWEPTVVSPRIAAQRSQFLFSKLCTANQGSLKLPKDDNSVLVLAISPSLKRVAREYLIEAFDIRNVSLFPDIEGFARANGVGENRWEMDRW